MDLLKENHPELAKRIASHLSLTGRVSIRRPIPAGSAIIVDSNKATILIDELGQTISVLPEGSCIPEDWDFDSIKDEAKVYEYTSTYGVALTTGSIISYSGMVGVIVEDDGSGKVTVEIDGSIQRWKWVFEDTECVIHFIAK
jgi:hypothetical protein